MKIVTQVTPTVFREEDFDRPAAETYEARLEQIGPFIQDNPAASQAATAMLLAGLAQHSAMIAGRAGTIVGLAVRSNAAVTAGVATFAATIAGAAKGDTALLNTTDTTKKVKMFTTPQPFIAGDLLAVTLATNGAYAPATLDIQAWLLIRWAPS